MVEFILSGLLITVGIGGLVLYYMAGDFVFSALCLIVVLGGVRLLSSVIKKREKTNIVNLDNKAIKNLDSALTIGRMIFFVCFGLILLIFLFFWAVGHGLNGIG